MKRFKMESSHPLIAHVIHAPHPDGEWVRFKELGAKLTVLRNTVGDTPELDNEDDHEALLEQAQLYDDVLTETYRALNKILKETIGGKN